MTVLQGWIKHSQMMPSLELVAAEGDMVLTSFPMQGGSFSQATAFRSRNPALPEKTGKEWEEQGLHPVSA